MTYAPGTLVLVLGQVSKTPDPSTENSPYIITFHPSPTDVAIHPGAIIGPATLIEKPLTPGDRVITPTHHPATIIALAGSDAWIRTDANSQTILPIANLIRQPSQ